MKLENSPARNYGCLSQTIPRIISECPLRAFNDVIKDILSANQTAVGWIHESWHTLISFTILLSIHFIFCLYNHVFYSYSCWCNFYFIYLLVDAHTKYILFIKQCTIFWRVITIVLGSLMNFPPESVELLSLDNRIEMVKFIFDLFVFRIILKSQVFVWLIFREKWRLFYCLILQKLCLFYL